MPEGRKGFFARHLDAGEIFGEILFGLIMALTFTLGAGISVTEGPGAIRTLLVTALGCNLAWGIIDGAMYVMGALLERGRRIRMLLSLQQATDPAAALAAVARELDPVLERVTTAEERAKLYRGILTMASRVEPERARITREDLAGAVASGLLVILTAFPAAIPFMVMEDHHLALRASNAFLVAMLFFIGFFWARFTGVNRWRAGLLMMLSGLALVKIAMLLGG
ncbi:MAG TPA: VIT1/CCC1 transporter family protein [Kiritimatiellia bacterium]|nr:VIT1/CCC1 transporter family protein [Kiritimatiellia bacterium]HRZ12001.1 VIT1/CCC1 transporter family protein [Kiritimatiellia bacterium]HSA17193.1 VIT1/CCC1 transporter family protein [Kiritimatiellia bacterium]